MLSSPQRTYESPLGSTENSLRGTIDLLISLGFKFQLIILSMYLENIKHPTWLRRVDFTVYFVVLKFMSAMNQHSTRFYVRLAPFCFMYSAFNFSNQRNLIIAYSLAAQAHPQSLYLHQAENGSDHIFYKH